jgi:hypothetical protein
MLLAPHAQELEVILQPVYNIIKAVTAVLCWLQQDALLASKGCQSAQLGCN